jgi:hypothetical protein
VNDGIGANVDAPDPDVPIAQAGLAALLGQQNYGEIIEIISCVSKAG